MKNSLLVGSCQCFKALENLLQEHLYWFCDEETKSEGETVKTDNCSLTPIWGSTFLPEVESTTTPKWRERT